MAAALEEARAYAPDSAPRLQGASASSAFSSRRSTRFRRPRDARPCGRSRRAHRRRRPRARHRSTPWPTRSTGRDSNSASRHVVEQARPVEAFDFHHGGAGRGLVVEIDARRTRKARGALLGRALGDARRAARFRRARVCAIDCRSRSTRAASPNGAALRVLDREDVEREAVGRRERLGIDDRAARYRDRAGKLREQARMVAACRDDLGHARKSLLSAVSANSSPFASASAISRA